jgi:hypothetical protein
MTNRYFDCFNFEHPAEIINDGFLNNFKLKKPSKTFREAIRHQHRALRQELIQHLDTTEFSLDHYPVPFAVLKYIFLKLQGMNPIEFTREQITVDLLREWQQFHGCMAEYRIVDKEINQQLSQKFLNYWLIY